ncbi:MAG: ABC transporter permease [Spirochaetales bacterium]|nr:ABC transporter permease [Spirochaetales bacterium]
MKHRRTEFFVNTLSLGITIGISFLIVILMILLMSETPLKTMYYFFLGPFTNKYYFGNMLNASIPLIFTGLGIALAFRSSMFNLGGEGQVYAGGLVATFFLLIINESGPAVLGILVALISSALLGALLAGMSGFFRMKWNTDELISSFLLSSAVVLIVNYFITGILNDPNTNLLTTPPVNERFWFLKIFLPSNLDISILFAVLTAVGVYFFLFYTKWGYEMRMCGLNREFSRYGGINVSRYMVMPMLLSGGLHGIAGSVAVMGTYHQCLKGFSGGIGWNGIAVALIAKNNPLAIIPAAVFFAYLDAGAKAAMLHSDVTFEIAAIVQSVIFFLVTARAIHDFIRFRKKEVQV